MCAITGPVALDPWLSLTLNGHARLRKPSYTLVTRMSTVLRALIRTKVIE
jgi:hypothetical protein